MILRGYIRTFALYIFLFFNRGVYFFVFSSGGCFLSSIFSNFEISEYVECLNSSGVLSFSCFPNSIFGGSFGYNVFSFDPPYTGYVGFSSNYKINFSVVYLGNETLLMSLSFSNIRHELMIGLNVFWNSGFSPVVT